MARPPSPPPDSPFSAFRGSGSAPVSGRDRRRFFVHLPGGMTATPAQQAAASSQAAESQPAESQAADSQADGSQSAQDGASAEPSA